MKLIARIEALFDEFGQGARGDPRHEPVSPLEHALQCAQLAERSGAGDALVAAALLHDIGHFVPTVPDFERRDDIHHLRAVAYLAPAFGAELIEPIRLHVEAKRYLVATDRSYATMLTSASVQSLRRQGGPMSVDETWRFEGQPFCQEAIALRRWDDAARQPGQTTPSLRYYLGLLEGLRDRPLADSRVGVESFSAA